MVVLEYCRMCGSTKEIEKHHLKPLSEGGLDTSENTVYLCHTCHVRLGEPGKRGRWRSSPMVRSTVGTFYLGEAYRDTFTVFQEICRREGTTSSKKIVSYITDYVSIHKEGNPQTLLKFAGLPKTLPLFRTCTRGADRLVDGTFPCGKDHRLITPELCVLRQKHSNCYRGKENEEAL
jgi:hypothetical protein